jgi:hypothetical protein
MIISILKKTVNGKPASPRCSARGFEIPNCFSAAPALPGPANIGKIGFTPANPAESAASGSGESAAT